MKPTDQRIVDAIFLAAASRPDQFPPPTGVEVAFAGRSNVGKSSLLNRLMGRKRLARTSSTPGCTRQVTFFEARTADQLLLRLVDLPGYGYAKRSQSERRSWGSLVESYLLERPTLALVVVLVDVRRGIEPDDQQLLELLDGPAAVSRKKLHALLVGTKLDKLPRAGQNPAMQRLEQQGGRSATRFSITLPQSQVELWHRIRKAIAEP